MLQLELSQITEEKLREAAEDCDKMAEIVDELCADRRKLEKELKTKVIVSKIYQKYDANGQKMWFHCDIAYINEDGMLVKDLICSDNVDEVHERIRKFRAVCRVGIDFVNVIRL